LVAPKCDELTPVYPAQLCQLRPRDFNSTVLDPHRTQLKKFWSPSEIEEVESDHRSLWKTYKDEASLRETIDAHENSLMFNDAWDSMKGRFPALRCFSSSLATSFPNTTSVESDFSILKWEKNPSRKSLTNLSLEGIFASKEHDQLKSISAARPHEHAD
jgi:hypothetical protein